MNALKNLLQKPADKRIPLLILTVVSAFITLDSLLRLLRLARLAWLYPVIYHDSFLLIWPGKKWSIDIVTWFFSQHNEHRIVWQRISSVIGEAILNMPPAAGGVPANILLLIAISGSIAWLCALLVRQRMTALCCWLICTLIAWNPWQGENIVWEFQTPWFFVTLLVLISTSVHLQAAKTKTYLKATKIFSALVPFLAIFATGQGFAAAAAMTIGAYGNNKKTGHLSLFSSVLSGMAFFSLGYARQGNNNPIAWSSHHFFLLATSSLPENHSIFLIICILLGIWTLQV